MAEIDVSEKILTSIRKDFNAGVKADAGISKLVNKIGSLPMAKSSVVKRFLYDGAFNVEFDSQGRILLPLSLREYADLQSEAHIIGVDSNIEIWNKDLWAKENMEYTPEAIASIVNELEI